ncbi:MAG: cupin domain-containing protein [Candidatus Eisenbacteria bacterium]
MSKNVHDTGDAHDARDDGPSPSPDRVEQSDVGERLQALRRTFGLSQRELAKRSGITNATISLIEQNRVSPSVASLKRVLSGFPISLAEFFGDGPHFDEPVFFRSNDLAEIGSGRISLRQVGHGESSRKLQVLHERYQPGSDTGKAMLVHAGEEAGVVVGGTIQITVGSRTEVLGPGDAYYFQSRLPHRFCNLGEEICEIVSVCTPPTF